QFQYPCESCESKGWWEPVPSPDPMQNGRRVCAGCNGTGYRIVEGEPCQHCGLDVGKDRVSCRINGVYEEWHLCSHCTMEWANIMDGQFKADNSVSAK